ncbi:hypothetical protein HNR42_001303 [Deinobacterium chartae]|uniref:Uncharacterized protein n=1 Tax=Deinobacterium chartae TaxID=521158 RepID=A0A841I0A9_9DEIO|nr:hypothetical protein [Deinobacterium chartae]MBB6097880.1 hypothetical protein [Deinobacterium chartae]
MTRISAWFHNMTQAREALDELERMGALNATIDEVEGDNPDYGNRVSAAEGPGLSTSGLSNGVDPLIIPGLPQRDPGPSPFAGSSEQRVIPSDAADDRVTREVETPVVVDRNDNLNRKEIERGSVVVSFDEGSLNLEAVRDVVERHWGRLEGRLG